MLYRATSADLSGIKVLAKFLCVKGVVFATFWQGFAVALGIRAGAIQHAIKPHGHDSEADLAVRLQNFVIWCAPAGATRKRASPYDACTCSHRAARSIEMLFFALAHSYAFSAREYWVEAGPHGAAQPPRSVWATVATVFDWSDVGHNMIGQVHFGANELVDGMQSAGSAVLGGVAWPFTQLKRQVVKARNSGADTGGDGGSGGVTPASGGRRAAAREAAQALLPSGAKSSG